MSATPVFCLFFFFFNDTATTEIYTLSLHDALPIYHAQPGRPAHRHLPRQRRRRPARSEEHTSELQSPCNLVCRLLLEKKKILSVDRSTLLQIILARASSFLFVELGCVTSTSSVAGH